MRLGASALPEAVSLPDFLEPRHLGSFESVPLLREADFSAKWIRITGYTRFSGLICRRA